jgi:hypothetical protein
VVGLLNINLDNYFAQLAEMAGPSPSKESFSYSKAGFYRYDLCVINRLYEVTECFPDALVSKQVAFPWIFQLEFSHLLASLYWTGFGIQRTFRRLNNPHR